MADPKKLHAPKVQVFNEPKCYRDTAPVRPLGCPWEMWGGAVAIDHGLVVWDVNTKDGQGAAVGLVRDLKPVARRALARYMIELWTRFEAGK